MLGNKIPCEELILKNPKNAIYMDLQAKLEFIKGNYRQAVGLQQQSMKLLNNDNPEYKARLAAYNTVLDILTGKK